MQIAAEGATTRPIAIVPAALVSASAIAMFGFGQNWLGYLSLTTGLLLALLTDRNGASTRLFDHLLLIAMSLTLISFMPLHADISWEAIGRFTLVLGGAVVIPYAVSRWVQREHLVRFPFRIERWTRAQWIYLVVVIIAAYLILPFYFLRSGVWQNWPAVETPSEIARLFGGVNAVGLWDELFFICVCYTLFMRHFRPWLANLLQAAIFVSFLWELGYQSWGPLLTIPFALVQGWLFSITRKNLLYVVAVHLLFDAIVFLVIVHAHHPEALPIFPLVS